LTVKRVDLLVARDGFLCYNIFHLFAYVNVRLHACILV